MFFNVKLGKFYMKILFSLFPSISQDPWKSMCFFHEKENNNIFYTKRGLDINYFNVEKEEGRREGGEGKGLCGGLGSRSWRKWRFLC